MPVGRYSRMRAQATLRNWLAFLTLRYDPAAQWEIQQYAIAVAGIIAQEFPQVWSLYHAPRERRAGLKGLIERCKLTLRKIRDSQDEGVYAKHYVTDMEEVLSHLNDTP